MVTTCSGTPSAWPGPCTTSSTGCAPTRSSSTTSPSVPGWVSPAGAPHADVVLGHPSALTVGDEVYGYPPAWPRASRPTPDALAELPALSERCATTSPRSGTPHWRSSTRPAARQRRRLRRDRRRPAAQLPRGAARPRPHRAAAAPHLPRLRGAEEARGRGGRDVARRGDQPVVYVSLGSFLSARSDVLATIVEALRPLDVRVALANGSTPRGLLGPLPESWLVREMLPQVTLLGALGRGGLARRQQQRHRGTDGRRAPAPAPPLHRPVRRGRRGRTAGVGLVPRPQRGDAGGHPTPRWRTPGSGRRPRAAAERAPPARGPGPGEPTRPCRPVGPRRGDPVGLRGRGRPLPVGESAEQVGRDGHGDGGGLLPTRPGTPMGVPDPGHGLCRMAFGRKALLEPAPLGRRPDQTDGPRCEHLSAASHSASPRRGRGS